MSKTSSPESTSVDSTRTKPQKWRAPLLRFLLEFAIVFTGVYSAFLLDSYREDRRREILKQELYYMLIDEVGSVAVGLAKQLSRFEKDFYEPLEQSEGPQSLRPYYEVKGDLSSPGLQALLQSGDWGVSSPGLLKLISDYRRAVGYFLKISDELRRLSIEQIAPALGEGPAAFYDEKSNLRPQYVWYPVLIYQLRHSMEDTVESAQKVVDYFEREYPETEAHPGVTSVIQPTSVRALRASQRFTLQVQGQPNRSSRHHPVRAKPLL